MDKSTSPSTHNEVKQKAHSTLLRTWFTAGLEAEHHLSQTGTSSTIFVGKAVLDSISNGEATWEYFVEDDFSDDQMKELLQRVTMAHRAYGIAPIPETTSTLGEGERPMDTSKIRLNHHNVKRNVANALYTLFSGHEGEKIVYPLEEITGKIGEYLTIPDNLIMARDLFDSAYEQCMSIEGKRIAREHRDHFKFAKRGEPSRTITEEEKVLLKVEVDKLLSQPLIETGIRYGLEPAQTLAFMAQLEGTITNYTDGHLKTFPHS